MSTNFEIASIYAEGLTKPFIPGPVESIEDKKLGALIDFFDKYVNDLEETNKALIDNDDDLLKTARIVKLHSLFCCLPEMTSFRSIGLENLISEVQQLVNATNEMGTNLKKIEDKIAQIESVNSLPRYSTEELESDLQCMNQQMQTLTTDRQKIKGEIDTLQPIVKKLNKPREKKAKLEKLKRAQSIKNAEIDTLHKKIQKTKEKLDEVNLKLNIENRSQKVVSDKIDQLITAQVKFFKFTEQNEKACAAKVNKLFKEHIDRKKLETGLLKYRSDLDKLLTEQTRREINNIHV